jgi:hypothetical protein
MAVVLNLRMTADLGPITLESTWRWLGAARKWRCQESATAVTANLVKDCLSARSTRTLVTKVIAEVVATLEGSTARTSADMFSLKTVINGSNMSIFQLTTLALDGKPLGSLLLAFTTAFVTSVSAAVEGDSAKSHALWRLNLALMTDCGRSRPSTTAVDSDSLEAGHAFTRMAELLTQVTTRQLLHARLGTIGYRVLA